jgi:hypothetical protein
LKSFFPIKISFLSSFSSNRLIKQSNKKKTKQNEGRQVHHIIQIVKLGFESFQIEESNKNGKQKKNLIALPGMFINVP